MCVRSSADMVGHVQGVFLFVSVHRLLSCVVLYNYVRGFGVSSANFTWAPDSSFSPVSLLCITPSVIQLYYRSHTFVKVSPLCQTQKQAFGAEKVSLMALETVAPPCHPWRETSSPHQELQGYSLKHFPVAAVSHDHMKLQFFKEGFISYRSSCWWSYSLTQEDYKSILSGWFGKYASVKSSIQLLPRV